MLLKFILVASYIAGQVVAGPVAKKPFSLNRQVIELTRSKIRAVLIVNRHRRTDGPYSLDATDKLEEASLVNFEAYLAKNPNNSNCTLENAAKRYEWYFCPITETFRRRLGDADSDDRSDLSEGQRKEYIAAVLCLQRKPPISPRDKYPGALNRFDDFVATHESMAGELHSTVSRMTSGFEMPRAKSDLQSHIFSQLIDYSFGHMRRLCVMSADIVDTNPTGTGLVMLRILSIRRCLMAMTLAWAEMVFLATIWEYHQWASKHRTI